MRPALTRRAFLAGTSGAIIVLAAGAGGGTSPADPDTGPHGPVYGRTGRHGIGPGTSSSPSPGVVTLIDGRVVEASHVTGAPIRAGASVLLSPEDDGSWSILYAEF